MPFKLFRYQTFPRRARVQIGLGVPRDPNPAGAGLGIFPGAGTGELIAGARNCPVIRAPHVTAYPGRRGRAP
jgi:hypothetical protein